MTSPDTTETHTNVLEIHGEGFESSLRKRPEVSTATFAGRLGGNQAFVADDASESGQALLSKQPDAVPLSSLRASIDLKGFVDADLWRQAVIEGWGTFLLIFLLGAMASGLTQLPQSIFAQSLYGSVVSWFGLSIFTYCAAPVSGGHLNPTITLATFFAGLSSFPRTVLYVVAQSIGAIVAGYWLRLGLGTSYFAAGVIPGCTVEPNLVSRGQLFVLEYTFCQILIFLAFGVGLDPRQGRILSPSYAPVLVGLTLGLGNLASIVAAPGYTGMSFNPARCLGLMTARNEMQYHYIHWLGTLTAAIFNGLVYHFAPPWKKPLGDNPSSFARHEQSKV